MNRDRRSRAPLAGTLLLTVLTLVLAAGCGTSAEVQPDDTAPTAEPTGEAEEPAPSDTEAKRAEPTEASSSNPNDADTSKVIVAADDIEAGSPLEDTDVTSKEVPSQYLPANPLLRSDIGLYIGHPVATDLREGDLILTSDFVVPEQAQGLAARVPDGQRALTLASDMVRGDTALIEPGDRVDILGTFHTDDDDIVTMSLLQNVTVLARGSCLSDRPGACDTEGGDVAIAVTPDEAELLTVVGSDGGLTLMLRNQEDIATVPVLRRSLREVLEDIDVIQEERNQRIQDNPPRSPDDTPSINITR